MAKYDKEVSRMLSLMEDKQTQKKPVSNIVYHANGADGKVYGILREGTKFYIKSTENGKENIAESYEYLGGFNNRREHEYKSCNEAEKHLENELIFLNEKYNKHENVSVVDFKRNEKSLNYLTEEARKEINRMNQIFENSCTIGMNCQKDYEPKGRSTGADTTKNNAPFEEKVNATLDKDPKFNGTVKGATENKEVKGIDADLQSDKKKTANTDTKGDYKDAHDDLEGEGVADKKPSGAKAIKMNESCFEEANDDVIDMDTLGDDEGFEDNSDPINVDFHNPDVPDDEQLPTPPSEINIPELANNDDLSDEDFDMTGEEDTVGDDVVGQGEDDLDSLLEDFENTYGKPSVDHSNQDMIAGEDDVMKNTCSQKGTDGKDAEWERINEEDGNVNEPAKQGNEETMKSYQRKGNLPVQCWDKMDSKKLNEAITTIVSDVYKKLTEGNKPKKETLQEAIDRIVKEEVTKLNAWGKHPRYQKPAFQTPANKEVLAGTAEKDWNDDSTKGEEPYGKKIGDGKPFDKIVNMLTDQVMANLKESMKRK